MKKLSFLLSISSIFLFSLFFASKVSAYYCGDILHLCDTAGGEDCWACPEDCGACSPSQPPPSQPPGTPSDPCGGNPGNCGVVAGCNCYEQVATCGVCSGSQRCPGSYSCPDGSIYYIVCSPSCSADPRTCHTSPSCEVPQDCTTLGGDAYCQAGSSSTPDACGPDTSECAVHLCGPGGNCYVDCSSCDGTSAGAQNWVCEGTSCVLRPCTTDCTNYCTVSSDCGGSTYKACSCPGGLPACVTVEGVAPDACQNAGDCSCPPSGDGTFRMRVWNDKDGDGSTNEISGSNDPDYIRNPSSTCPGLTFTDAATWVRYTGTEFIALLPHQCDATGPYGSEGLAPGTYTFWAEAPTGWETTTVPRAFTINSGSTTTATFGLWRLPPTCTITGDTTLTLGVVGSWNAGAIAPGGGNADVEITQNTEQVVSTSSRLEFSDCGNTDSTCTVSANWAPPALGTYYLSCLGYSDRTCWPFGGDATHPDCGANSSMTVTVTRPGPWWQTVGGDVHASGNISSSIPDASLISNAYLSLADGTSSPGVVSYGGTLSINNQLVSSTGWQANTNYDVGSVGFDYLKNRLGIDTDSVETCEDYSSCNIPAAGDGTHIYYYDNAGSGLAINFESRTIGAGEKVIIFATGDVIVKGDITVTSQGFLAIISKTNLTFGSGVERAEGFFLADGVLRVASRADGLGAYDDPFVGEGSFVGQNGIGLDRDLGEGSANLVPAEVFVARPDFFINAPVEFLISESLFQEVAP
jgi:hypothetical protein